MKHLQKPLTILHLDENAKDKLVREFSNSPDIVYYIIPVGISVKVKDGDFANIIKQA